MISPKANAGSHVLVVDDDLEAREVLSALLEDCGYPVLTAGNGIEALSCLQNSAFAVGLIILDLMMPMADGYQFWEFQSQNLLSRISR